ncbi:HAD family hydrolase [Zunongwangia sp. HRR-M8]|uniref:HAD family hydrolase n=1 Tax=Zunongwangia sp. HRR-M8 TaxID=3015170 RepID=UPI0022DD5C44|nr:HAD family hydrolase [Zunongwangia sp. HRR-M8]WBL22337.1 HAD family hydrolase [Zunongwangia sp. HRR-M8]
MANKSRVNFVVTDLDDTIWDWLKMWYSSFEPYLKRISLEYGIDIEELTDDFKKVHQRYRTSESSFIYKDLETLSKENKATFELAKAGGKSILHEYYSLKKNNLELYTNVLETLQKIKQEGAMVIGFTESNAFFTKYRIKHLQLDGLFDCIYAPIDMEVPETVYRHYSEESWEPKKTEFRYLAKNTRKPAPEILEIIIRDFKASKENTIYIGDKLDKDISMAKDAGITCVYAKYGHKIESEQYELLKKVTHWTKEDVEREIEFKASHQTMPIADYTLEKSFKELEGYFTFYQFPQTKFIEPSYDNIIQVWAKTIDVQQHFNDIALRIRNITLTVFTFLIGAIGFTTKDHLYITISDNAVSYTALIAALGIIIIAAFFYMDRYWYHNLLVGAVNQGLEIEKKWGNIFPEMRLTNSIGNSSPHTFVLWKIHSKHKFLIFYGILAGSMFLIFCLTI